MTTWLNLAAIALAGATGALCRYGITLAATVIPGGSTMLGTTVVNLIGCALLGGVSALGDVEGESMERLMLALRVGFLGSLTTFSTFAYESTSLAGAGRWGASAVYLLANLLVGFVVLVIAGEVVKGWMQ
jgi:CrcB protein